MERDRGELESDADQQQCEAEVQPAPTTLPKAHPRREQRQVEAAPAGVEQRRTEQQEGGGRGGDDQVGHPGRHRSGPDAQIGHEAVE